MPPGTNGMVVHDLRPHLVGTGFKGGLPLQFQQEGDSFEDLSSSFSGRVPRLSSPRRIASLGLRREGECLRTILPHKPHG